MDTCHSCVTECGRMPKISGCMPGSSGGCAYTELAQGLDRREQESHGLS